MRQTPSCNIEQASNGGHTVTMRKPSPKNEWREPESKVYGKGEHEKMISDVRKHLGIGGAKKAAPPAKVKAAPMAGPKGGAIATRMAGSAPSGPAGI